MAKEVKRKCPQCGELKSFRSDQKTCGCKPPKVGEKHDIKGDKWVIDLPKTRICTEADLIKEFEIDTDKWEIERFVANKWEMGYVQELDATTSADGKHKKELRQAAALPLYQVKAYLRLKRFSSTEGYVTDNARLRSQLQKVQHQLKSERELVKRLSANHFGYDEFLSNLKQVRTIVGDPQLPKQLIKTHAPLYIPSVAAGHTEDAVLLLSDTHFGDRITREDTSGFPEFDLEIAGNRFGYIIRGAKQVLSLHRTAYPIKKLYVWFGGDMGNGDLHDAPQSNELFIAPQVDFTYKMLKMGVEDLLTLTEPDPKTGVRVVEEVVMLFTIGNHMRLDEKMPYKLQAQRTLDWLIYQLLIDKFKNHPHVTVRTEMAPFIFENIRGHRYGFCHGMQVGYKNSPDAQNKSISRFLSLVRALFDSPEWRKANGLEGETFGRMCIGDIHVPLSFPRFKSNGCLNGQNELGVNWMLEPIPAGQQIFGVADDYQETWSYFLTCSHVQRAVEDSNPYGLYAAEYAKRWGR